MLQLGGAGDDDEEGVNVPGDDDNFSYVSAPASDYSVTTVGSDTLNNRSVEDVTAPTTTPAAEKQPPPVKAPELNKVHMTS